MENKNNNLKNFLRNKLNEFDGPDDGWDRPDAEVWAQAKRHIVIPKNPDRAGVRILSAAISVALILFLGGYLLWQNHAIKKLEIALDHQKGKTEQALQINAVVEKKYAVEKSRMLNENEKTNKEKKLITEQKTKLERIVSQQRKAISQLKLGTKINNVRPPSDNYAGILNDDKTEIYLSENKKDTLLSVFQDLAILPQKRAMVNSSAFPELNTPTQIIPIKEKRGEFEIGYEYAWIKMGLPSTESIDNKKDTWYNFNSEINFNFLHGISLAYSPKNNLFFRTGLRKAKASIVRSSKFIHYYDKSKEYEKPGGGWENNLTLNFENPYFERQSDVGIVIPEDKEFQEEDLLVLVVHDFQEFDFYQIPLGFEYFFGKQKLKGQLQAGAQWNKMIFGKYDYKVETEDKELSIDKVELADKSNVSKEFYSAYAGLGLDYQLARHLHARAALTYDFNFINNKTTNCLNAGLVSKSLKLGLNYRF